MGSWACGKRLRSYPSFHHLAGDCYGFDVVSGLIFGNEGMIGWDQCIWVNSTDQDLIKINPLEKLRPVLASQRRDDWEHRLCRLSDKNHAATMQQEINSCPQNLARIGEIV